MANLFICNISLHFGLFPGKTNYEIYQKTQKTLFWGHFGPFYPNLDKNEFSRKKGLCQFFDIRIIYHRAKNQKKLMSHS